MCLSFNDMNVLFLNGNDKAVREMSGIPLPLRLSRSPLPLVDLHTERLLRSLLRTSPCPSAVRAPERREHASSAACAGAEKAPAPLEGNRPGPWLLPQLCQPRADTASTRCPDGSVRRSGCTGSVCAGVLPIFTTPGTRRGKEVQRALHVYARGPPLG